MLRCERRRLICWVLLFASLSIATFLGWRFYVVQTSVDLFTGKERDRRLFMGTCVSEFVRETPFSITLENGNEKDSDWRVVSEMRLFQKWSQHFRHHSTPTLLKEAVLVGDILGAPREERRRIGFKILKQIREGDHMGARKILESWRQGEKEPRVP